MTSAAIWSAVGNLASKAEVALLSIFGARDLTGVEFGAFMSWIGLLYIAVVFADFGLTSFLQRQLAVSAVDVRDTFSIAAAVGVVTLAPFAIVAALSAFVLGSFELLGPLVVVVLGIWILLALTNGICNAAYSGRLLFQKANSLSGAGRAVATVVMCVHQLFGSPTALSLALIIAGGEAIGIVLQVIGLPRQRRAPVPVPRLIRSLIPYFLNNLANSTYSRGDVPAVALVAGNSAAGIYAPASQLQSLVLSLPYILSAGTLPVASRSYRDGGTSRLLKRTMLVTVASSCAAVLICAVLCPLFIPLVLGEGFRASVLPCQVVLLSVPLAAAHMVLAQILIGHGHAQITARATVLALAFGLIALLVLGAAFGPIGAACGVVARDAFLLVIYLRAWRGVDQQRSEAAPV